ncbi:MAG: hypothetical protein GWN00_21195, partial [Aliifodinibius sp.]|nr:hypothetical protein [Fodinibius sp.]NIY27231.1 hypothetical protein [Fodinibius sp.]
MDTELDLSSATFIGDDINDWYGHSLAAAGDVNGDGYNDIIIGAPHNGDAGVKAGHTYLVLGQRSGWLMNVKPSEVDASFRGETAGDESGY